MAAYLKRIITGALLASVFAITYLFLPVYAFDLLIACAFMYIATQEWPQFFSPQGIYFWLLGACYLGIPCYAALALNHDAIARILIPFMVLLVGSHDSGGYIVGSLCGTHLIAPSISPKKSWEGFAGSITLSIIAYTCWMAFMHAYIVWHTALPFLLVLNVVALCGDLYESSLKRNAKLKDAGSLLPGHGGLLDRFDAMLPVIVWFYFARTSVLHIAGVL